MGRKARPAVASPWKLKLLNAGNTETGKVPSQEVDISFELIRKNKCLPFLQRNYSDQSHSSIQNRAVEKNLANK